MQQGLNKAYLIGHVGQDPELRHTVSGQPTAKLSLATPNARKVDGEWVDTPDWHRLTFFDEKATFITSRARKGDSLAVECAIRPHSWTDKDGLVHHEVQLVVENILWLNAKNRPTSEPG